MIDFVEQNLPGRKKEGTQNDSLRQQFKETFGFFPDEKRKGREREIMGLISRLYDEYKETESFLGLSDGQRREILKGEPGKHGITDPENWFDEITETLKKLRSNLNKALSVAREFVNEDLSFITQFANKDLILKTRDLIKSEQLEIEGGRITIPQQEILKGKITLKRK